MSGLKMSSFPARIMPARAEKIPTVQSVRWSLGGATTQISLRRDALHAFAERDRGENMSKVRWHIRLGIGGL